MKWMFDDIDVDESGEIDYGEFFEVTLLLSQTCSSFPIVVLVNRRPNCRTAGVKECVVNQ